MTEPQRQMDDDMVVRGLAKRTRETYLAAVTGLAKYQPADPAARRVAVPQDPVADV